MHVNVQEHGVQMCPIHSMKKKNHQQHKIMNPFGQMFVKKNPTFFHSFIFKNPKALPFYCANHDIYYIINICIVNSDIGIIISLFLCFLSWQCNQFGTKILHLHLKLLEEGQRRRMRWWGLGERKWMTIWMHWGMVYIYIY